MSARNEDPAAFLEGKALIDDTVQKLIAITGRSEAATTPGDFAHYLWLMAAVLDKRSALFGLHHLDKFPTCPDVPNVSPGSGR